ncbi:MAG: hypothetical protein IE887_10650 [Campylobacterales bacterium]|nr:hypothetical protein [Campylobacterales bacterium]
MLSKRRKTIRTAIEELKNVGWEIREIKGDNGVVFEIKRASS